MEHSTTVTSFELVSGLEIHVQLNTNSKIFSSDSASFGGEPNAHTSPVSLALPGTLPKLNKEVIEKAIRIGLALNCKINQLNTFDRKHYFYADLPKGYQITQDTTPICSKGYIDLLMPNGDVKTIRINRIHLEEDAGKSMHDQDPDYSFVDLNRAGVPLIEIVTEPDIRNAEEAAALLTEIRKLVRHLNVGDGNMEEGSLRCDANISIRPAGDETYHTRCEVKNLNSIRNLRKAISYEYGRQLKLVTEGGKVIQSTLNFDSNLGTTSPMRTKEEANDYRYFPDPDLLPVFISDEWLSTIKLTMPLLPGELAANLAHTAGITLPEAALIVEDKELLGYFHSAGSIVNSQKTLVNWILGPLRAFLTDKQLSISEFGINAEQFAEIVNLVDSKLITQQLAFQKLIPALILSPLSNVKVLAKELNILITDNTDELDEIVAEVLNKFSSQVAAYKNGKKGVLGLFVGEVMKLAKGKADPNKVNTVILEKLNQ